VLAELSLVDWIALVLAAGCVGVAKTALGGIGTVAVALFAAVLPARESTGALLPLLIAGDLVAVLAYSRHGSRRTVLGLLPGVVPGLVLGTVFLALVGDTVLRLSIGVILLALTAWQLAQRVRGTTPTLMEVPSHTRATRSTTVAAGVGGGFTTMTANAAGPLMTVYLLMSGLPKLQMLGTAAWFYLVVNLMKVPFSAGLHLIDPASLVLDAALLPAMLLGALAGWRLIQRLDQRQFEVAALALGALSAGFLIVTV
jgi:uncharacterized membrane protein YfcA